MTVQPRGSGRPEMQELGLDDRPQELPAAAGPAGDDEGQQPVTTPPLDLVWRKTSRSGTNGACVEVRLTGNTIQVRDSKDLKDGHILAFTHEEWTAFLGGVQDGEFRTA